MQSIANGPIKGGPGFNSVKLSNGGKSSQGNNKLNSFRGGPIKAMQGAFENSDF